MEITTLSWEDYRDKANELKANNGLTPSQIKEKLGLPFWDGKEYHISSDGKGGISRRTREARSRSQKKASTKRNKFLEKSTPPNVNTAEVRRIEAEVKNQGLELDHIAEVSRTGRAIEDFGDDPVRIMRYQKAIKSGHQPANFQALTQYENSKKNRDYKRLDKKLAQPRLPSPLQLIQQQMSSFLKGQGIPRTPIRSFTESQLGNESHPMGGNVIDTDPLGGMGLPMRTP